MLALCIGAAPLAEVTSENVRPAARAILSRALLTHVQENGPYEVTPERRALLNTIRYAEEPGKMDRTRATRSCTGGMFLACQASRPRCREGTPVPQPGPIGSFRPHGRSGQRAETGFEPQHQDQAALHLVKRRALQEIDQKD